VLVEISFSSVGREVAYNVRGPWIESHQGTLHFSEIKYTLLLQLTLYKPITVCWSSTDIIIISLNVTLSCHDIVTVEYILSQKNAMSPDGIRSRDLSHCKPTHCDGFIQC
jgi:hypothetical protein